MRGINKVILVGTVGRDPEIRSFAANSGTITNISLATSEVWKEKQTGQATEQTEWHRVTAWGKTADIIEKFVNKGKEVAIEGKLSYRSYDDKEGNKKYVTEITAHEILLLGK